MNIIIVCCVTCVHVSRTEMSTARILEILVLWTITTWCTAFSAAGAQHILYSPWATALSSHGLLSRCSF